MYYTILHKTALHYTITIGRAGLLHRRAPAAEEPVPEHGHPEGPLVMILQI